jgi:hypothetical protein
MSPTLQTLLLGFMFLTAVAVLGYLLGRASGRSKAIRVFFPLWLAYCVWHMSVGMGHGYSFASELPFLLLNFGLPALLALWLLKKMR